jgi:hypothetical protein
MPEQYSTKTNLHSSRKPTKSQGFCAKCRSRGGGWMRWSKTGRSCARQKRLSPLPATLQLLIYPLTLSDHAHFHASCQHPKEHENIAKSFNSITVVEPIQNKSALCSILAFSCRVLNQATTSTHRMYNINIHQHLQHASTFHRSN